MKITMIGTGYVGLVTGTCFAEMGNDVVCVDIDEAKLAALGRGEVPIHEPGLDELIIRNVESGRLQFSSVLRNSLNESDVVFIAVGTPPNEDGSADLSHVLTVARQIGENLERNTVVVDKSTVPVGTAGQVLATIEAETRRRGVDFSVDVVSNPEFLKEGAAVADFMSPDRIVVGTEMDASKTLMRELYAPFSRNHDKIHFMGVRDAEMTKYAANAMLATKISFMNEIALMCDEFGVDVEQVRKGIGSDPRIGYSFIYPGAGYGGSCFPKDVRALIAMAEQKGVQNFMFSAVEQRNEAQKQVLVEKIVRQFGTDLSGKKFAVWGLAFKPETDDVREASSLVLIQALVDRGAKIAAFDPKAMETSKHVLAAIADHIEFAPGMYECLTDADALVVMTEWKQFRQPDFASIASTLATKTVFDGRNIYDPLALTRHQLRHVGIGRGNVIE